MRAVSLLSIAATMSMVCRASAFLASHRRIGYRTTACIWDRRVHFSPSALQVKHTEDDNRDILEPLTRTQIRKLKIASLRDELAKRGLDTEGTRPILMSRLLDTVDREPSIATKKEQKETCPDEGCPTLDPDETYVLRVKGHSNMSYSSSGIGLVLYNAGTVREVWVARKYFPRNHSSFELDYKASVFGLLCVYEQGAKKVVLQTDNDVMLKQVTGKYSVNKPQLKDLCASLKDVLNEFSVFKVMHIASAENTRAKNLAQRAMATKKTVGFPGKDEVESSTDEVIDSVPGSFTDEAEEDPFNEAFNEESSTIISPDKTYLLQFDGGARGNPGIAGSGMVLYDPDDMKELWCGWKYLGDNVTNNAAEYNGLLLGIYCARSLGVKKIRAEGDSRLIVKHVTGAYKAKEPNLKKLLKACKDAIQHLDFFEIDHVPRAANKRADQLANQAMDTRGSFGFDVLD